LTRRRTVRRLCPHPLLHYCQYVPLDCAPGSVSGAKLRVAFHLRVKEKGRGNDVGPTCQRQQPNCGAFSTSIYCFITTWPRRHLQPSTLFSSFNFNPCRHSIPLQLQSSLPTSSLVAANFNPLSYGPPWAHYLGGYQDRLLGGPLGLPGLRYTAPDGVEHKDNGGEVLG
jgi:hypothetical protein